MRVEILGTEYECHPLSAGDRLQWNLTVHYECLRTFYSDLHERVEHLPADLQAVVFGKHSPPERLDASMPLYYKTVCTRNCLEVALMMVCHEDIECPTFEDHEAPSIFSAIRHLILDSGAPTLDTPERQQAAQEVFDKLEDDNGG